jgi:hypothetical protein
MYENYLENYINKGGHRHQPSQVANTMLLFKACKEKLRTLKRIKLDSSIAPDSYIYRIRMAGF